MHNNYPKELLSKASLIKLLICDVDGVLSDGKVYFTNQGDEIKNFSIKDGLGIKLLQRNSVDVAIITGRESKIVEQRSRELGISHIYQGQTDKQAAFDNLLNKLSLSKQQVAYVGDDLPDLPLIKQVGLGISVSDGYSLVCQQADWVTEKKGGDGAVREVADLLLFSQNKLDSVYAGYTG
jgi:3-deoxy-D-manno-octulosonate 8-phosphate phosphatase (KDO 8-P phosphatase)